MNTYLTGQLVEIHDRELLEDAREYRRAHAARPSARFRRRQARRGAS